MPRSICIVAVLGMFLLLPIFTPARRIVLTQRAQERPVLQCDPPPVLTERNRLVPA